MSTNGKAPARVVLIKSKNRLSVSETKTKWSVIANGFRLADQPEIEGSLSDCETATR